MSQKESQTGLTSLEAVCRAREECPTPRFVSVGDRAADVYDVLAAERPEGVERLMRASWDRGVRAPARDGWATVERPPVVERLLVQVPRRGPQPAREATLALRLCPLTLSAPRHRQAEGLPAGSLWAVQVVEVAPPETVAPIEWMRLTTVGVHTVEEAIERVEWYVCRWGIETFYQDGKTHLELDEDRMRSAEAIQKHWCLVFVTYSFWHLDCLPPSPAKGSLPIKTIGEACR